MTINEKLKWAFRGSTLALAAFAAWYAHSAYQYAKRAGDVGHSVSNTSSCILADTRALHAKLDRLTVGSEEPMGAAGDEPHGRIIPTIRNTTKEAEQAVIEARDMLKRFDRMLDDIEAGRTQVKLSGSLWKGEASARLERN